MTETTKNQGAPRSLLAFLREGRAGDERRMKTAGPRAWNRFWGPRRLIALGMLLLLPLVGVFGATAAFADNSSSSNNNDSMQYSFYKVASSTTAFFSTVQQPDSSMKFSGSWTNFMKDPGSAGSLLGYADPDFSSVSGWLASKLSGSSDAIGYDTLQLRGSGDSSSYANTNFQGMVNYAYFGATLKGLGLDGTSTGLSVGFMNWLGGGIIMLLFVMGGAVDFVFNAIIGVLSLLNPFKLFFAAVNAISPNLANGMVGNGSPDVGPLNGLVSWIGGWYQLLNALSWQVMVPLFIAVLLFSLFMFKKMDRGGALKKILIRVVFIGIGLPLLGTMYTGMLDSMATATQSGGTGSARVVMSTYVDFENWAMNSRLAIPSDAVIEWDPSSSQPSGTAQSDIRNTALAINNQSLAIGLSPIVSSGSTDASWANQIMQGGSADAATPELTFAKTVDMLWRYMQGAQVSSASFETIAKGDLSQSDYYNSNASTVKGWFDNLTGDANSLNSADPTQNPLVAVTPGTGLRATDNAGVTKFTSAIANCAWSGTSIVNVSGGAPRACNLSPLAMYNYLNTDFDSTSMRMYSSSNVASEATRSIHNSVDQVGTGTMSFLYWLNATVLLGAFVLIGLGYSFTLLFASIRRSFQIVTAVPFATLGAIAAIAKVVVYSVALILEVVITIFTYQLVQQFLTSLPQIIEMPFATVLNNGSGGAVAGFVAWLVSGWGFGLVVSLLSIIGVIAFTVLAMRIRKVLVKAIEEAVTKLVEKFMDTQVGMPGGGKLAPALAGGLAQGAGAAAANRMMTGGNKGAIGNQLPGANQPGGPDGVATAGGTTSTDPGPDGGDGQLELTGSVKGAEGNGDPGSGMSGLPSGNGDGSAVKDEVALGRSVEQNGLSKPGEMRAPQVGDDAMSSASESIDKSAAGYKAADKKTLEAGTAGAKAVGNGAVAAGKGVAGDYAGAAKSVGKALEQGGKAAVAAQQAKQLNANAGRSSLDKPSPKTAQRSAQRSAQRAATANQVSQAGGAVSRAAGSVGGGKASETPKPQPKSAPPAPRKVQPAPQPKQQVQPAPKAASAAPQPKTPRAPKPAPQRAPRPTTHTPRSSAPQGSKSDTDNSGTR